MVMVNIYVVIEVGVDVIDVLVGGIGGCLFVFVVIGNVVMEDVVYMFDCFGIEMGFDFDKLIVMVKWLEIDGLKYLVESVLLKVGGFF